MVNKDKVKLLTINELCDAFSLKRSYIYSLTHTGKIPFIKIGRLLRFCPREIEMWIEKRKNNACQ